MLIFVAGTILLTLGLAVLTTQTALLLRRGPLPVNPLLTWPDNIFRLLLIALCLGLILTAQWSAGLPTTAFGFVPFSLSRDLLGGVALGLLLPLVANALSILILPGRGNAFYSRNAILTMRPHSRDQLVVIIAAAFPAALLEELLFRAMLLSGMSAALHLPIGLALVVSSLAFGSMHLAQGLWGALVTALIGALLGAALLLTGGFWLPLIAHWTMNSAQFTLAYLRPDLIGAE
ncbi:MAG: CPBP family intramembrane metalloprotease [Ardenticatenaceae bacterium]|nr:CPBP family intramembrane metalloprotease [Ardenticatenaceae bacterium]